MAKRAAKVETLGALAYLKAPEEHPARPVCVLFGTEGFLRSLVRDRIRAEVLGDEDREFSLTSFEGKTADFAEVVRELSTVSMFGAGRRLVEIDGADPFVKENRPDLEDYVESPSDGGVLILFVDSFPSNTRLFKFVAAHGLAVDCSAPAVNQVTAWLKTWAKTQHKMQIGSDVARLLVDIVGPELGLLDQELAKLALVVEKGEPVSEELVYKMVANWRAKTAWDMLDMALEGNAKDAMVQLDRLLLGGEQPIAVLGQIAANLRRLAAATRIVFQAQAAGNRVNLNAALTEVKIPRFALQKSSAQLRHLGRVRAKELYRQLIEADMGMKGKSALPPRLILERLLFWLAAERKAEAGR